MKKSLLALAVLGAFAGVASAQSSVTIYGIVDMAVAKSNGGTANQPSQGTTTASKAYQMVNGASNRIGFRGNEDLGGGLSAQFVLEHRFTADTGAANAVFWHGASYVQLTSKQAGSVYLGRRTTPSYDLAGKMDPFGWAGVGEMGSLQMGNYHSPDPAIANPGNNGTSVTGSSIRTSNTVGYISPNIAGFTVRAMGSLSEATQIGRAMSLNANYEAGPLYVGVSGEKVYKGLYHDQGIYNAGVSYDLGFTKIMGYYAHTQYARSSTNAAGTATATSCPVVATTAANCFLGTNPGGVYNRTNANVWEIGALTPIGGGNLKAGYIRVNPKGQNNTIQKFGVGYDYFLSKRTRIYADGAYAKEDRQTNNKIFALGVRHDF